MKSTAAPRIGILGGGQLARMLALAGAPLGARFVVLDSTADACAGQVAPLISADWRDQGALAELASRTDVITFDFENVPATTVEWLQAQSPVFPSPRALALAQDRLAEKELFARIGLDTAAHAAVDTRVDLDQAIASLGVPSLLKTRRLGYDGKGQFRIAGVEDADAAWAALGEQARAHGLVLEAWVPFERELSVLAVRSRDGDFRAWPLVQNWHADGILSMSMAPASVPASLAQAALEHARTLAEELAYVGVFALELFVDKGRLLGNEMAPRVHNSGHWTLEGAETSQFENHLRAVLDLPLGGTDALAPSLMFNWIGELPHPHTVLAHTGAHWHDYGKTPRPGRKVGHATLRASGWKRLRERAIALAADLGRERQLAPVLPWMDAAIADG